MARDAVRSGALGILTLGTDVVVGVWLLFLFGLALAWDPLDRRFGFHDRRRLTKSDEQPGAYGFGGPPEDEEDEREAR